MRAFLMQPTAPAGGGGSYDRDGQGTAPPADIPRLEGGFSAGRSDSVDRFKWDAVSGKALTSP